MRTMKQVLSSLKRLAVLLSAGFSLILAWLVKDEITPILMGGKTFDERSLAARVVIVTLLTAAFFIYLLVVQVINRRINDQSGFSAASFLAITGGLTGAFVFVNVFGLGTLNGQRVDWLMNIGDNAMHYLGWVFYRHDPWAFPLTFSQSLGYPYGISVSLTDPVTLFIIPFKALRSILPEPYQYFGLWTIFCFILQGAFSALIIYETTRSAAKTAARLAALLAPLFFCLATILIYRVYTYIPHVGQWTILAGLYLFFLNRREKKYNAWWPLVLCAGLLVQPYLVGIIFVLFLGTMVERFIIDKDWRAIVIHLAVNLAAVGLVMWVTGMSGGDYSMSGAGVDYFKSNLNSLVNPVNKGWSVFLPPLPLAEGTYPNLHYLGFGMILLFAFTLIGFFYSNWRTLGRILKHNLVLIAMMALLTVLSLGNVVTLNDKILFTYQLPEPLMKAWAIFRATERFLWPVFYLIFIFAISQAVKLMRSNPKIALVLLLAFCIQYADIAPLLREKYATFHDPQGSETPLKSDFWADAASQYRSLVMLPLNLDNWARLTEYAALNRMTTNYFYFGRDTAEISSGAAEKINQLEGGQITPGDLYIIKDSPTLKKVCNLVGKGASLAYVNREWVLAPDFKGDMSTYPDVTITGENFGCSTIDLANFLKRYQDKLVVISVMEDGSQAMDAASAAGMKAAGFSVDLRGQSGKSFVGVSEAGKLILEKMADGRIDFEAVQGEMINGIEIPVDLEVSSAGRISGEETSQILIDGADYSFGRRGLNVSVYDPSTGKVVDNALFEMQTDTTNY